MGLVELNDKIIIFGNSGSGKSTLAKEYAEKYSLAHLDLDILAWENTIPPVRKPLKDSKGNIDHFINNNETWVIEGGYSDLIELVLGYANKTIFLNPGVETCIENCKKRPWEPHKYATIEAQNKNLDMLINWVKEYPIRKDEFSLFSHQTLFKKFDGNKIEYNSNDRPGKTIN